MTQPRRQPAVNISQHDYLTSRQAAALLGVCPRTLLRAVQRGEIAPARRTPGGHSRFHRAAVEAYAHQLAARPGATTGDEVRATGDEVTASWLH